MILRYLIAGGGTTIFAIGLLYVLNSLVGMQYLLASSLTFVVGLVLSYIVHKYWTFENKNPDHVSQFSRHASLAGWNFCLNALLMLFFVGKLGLIPVLGQTVTSGLIAIQSFIIYRKKVFI